MKFKGWDKVRLRNDEGQEVESIAPLIISASRCTDIGAFYAEWFFNRLRKGYIRWVNPFSFKSQYVSFEKARLIVFWSKNPAPLIPFLGELDKRNIRYMIQFTLNDYESEGLERNVPPLEFRVETFRRLAETVGKERLLWRFDPLILTDKITPEVLAAKLRTVSDLVAPYTSRLYISFIVKYAKVTAALKRAGINLRQFDTEAIETVGAALREIGHKHRLKVYSCAMMEELSQYGVAHGACIDPYHIAEIFRDDTVLSGFCADQNVAQVNLFVNNGSLFDSPVHPLKDPGQRELCRCIATKDIGSYDTCSHFCSYCYANCSEKKVRSNILKFDNLGDSLML